MKRCSQCSRLYADAAFQFCLDDGADLIAVNNQATERFVAVPAHVPQNVRAAGKFKWLAYSLLGGFGILLVLSLSAAGLYVIFRGDAVTPVQTDAPDNRSAPIISPPLFSSDDETEIKVIMEKISAAFVANDTKTLDYYLVDEYLEEDSDGGKFTKKDALKPETLGERVSLHYTDLKVAVEKNEAAVTGIGESKFRILGTLVTQKYKFKSKLAKRDGRWRGVYSYSEYLR